MSMASNASIPMSCSIYLEQSWIELWNGR
jgi:hypothetical protein